MSNDNRAMIFGRGSNLTCPTTKSPPKTGTTEDYRDSWTVGYTPAIATAFWFGNANFSAMARHLEASVIAAPVWHSSMEWTLNNHLKRPSSEGFAKPAGLNQFLRREGAVDPAWNLTLPAHAAAGGHRRLALWIIIRGRRSPGNGGLTPPIRPFLRSVANLEP